MLEIQNLICGYGPKIVLKGVSFKVNRGEVLGIIGPNGSGKTTLLRAITAVLKPKSGEVIFEGNNIQKMQYKVLAKKIAVVSQGSPVNSMSVEEFVLLGRIPYYKKFQFLEQEDDFEIAKQMMSLTDTFRLKDRCLSEVSGGERQLAVIARSLTQEPKLLLLDEPTAHLDITHQVAILDLISRLNKELGLTVIMVLHDLNLASEYCQRLVFINKGQIYKIGCPKEVLTYQAIEEVYKTTVVVRENPISAKPHCFLVSEEEKKRREKL